MHARIARLAPLALASLALALGAYGAYTGQAHTGEVNGLPSIPRCVNDDFNDGTQDRCWTESPDGVLVIDSTDTVVSIPGGGDVTVAPCEWWADTARPVLPPLTRTDVCVAEDGALSTVAPS